MVVHRPEDECREEFHASEDGAAHEHALGDFPEEGLLNLLKPHDVDDERDDDSDDEHPEHESLDVGYLVHIIDF